MNDPLLAIHKDAEGKISVQAVRFIPLDELTQPSRPIPDNFAEMIRTMPRGQVRKHFRVGTVIFAKWLKSIDAPVNRFQAAPTPVPEDFEALAPTHTGKALSEYYGVSKDVITRWRKITDIRSPYSLRKKKGPTTPKARSTHSWGAPKVTVMDTRTTSPMSKAQDFMQRQGWPCWRCNENGSFNRKGTHFHLGRLIVTESELLARAERKGWRQDDWQQIAA